MEKVDSGYTKNEVAEQTGLTKRQVQWFTEAGAVIPGIDKGLGRGHVRRYSKNNIESFKKIKNFVGLGINTKMIKEFLRIGLLFIPNKDSWISVKDKLPEPDQHVLVWARKYEICCAAYYPEFKKPWHDLKDDYCGLLEVTHWMPMPDPPKEA